MNTSARLGILLAGFVVLLAGCSTATRRPDVTRSIESRAQLASLAYWRATGRVAVKVGEDGLTAQFDWQQSGERGHLGLHGPFGAGAVEVALAPEHISISTGGEPAMELDAPFEALDALMVMHCGFAVPFEAMRYWVTGVPQPGLASRGDASDFEQLGWRVLIERVGWVPGAPAALPSRLEITRGDTRIRWLVDQWRVPYP